MDISISIVAFKSKKLLKDLLESIKSSETNYTWEVIIVDNGSFDGTVEMLEQEFLSDSFWQNKLRLIKNTNEGFGRGHNRAIKVATGEYTLILNPDSKLMPNTLEDMVSLMKSHPEIGISTPKLIKADGTMDLACRRTFPTPTSAIYRFLGLSLLFPKSKRFASYNQTFAPEDQEMEIDACNGAFMLVSKACMDVVKGFDEDFFMYDEDIDFCLRAKQAGFKVWYYPKVIAYHYKGQSSKLVANWMLREFHRSKWIYYKKHFQDKYFFLFNWFIFISIWARYCLKVMQNFLRKEKYVSK
jgi:GT2 family glycosyltransferase